MRTSRTFEHHVHRHLRRIWQGEQVATVPIATVWFSMTTKRSPLPLATGTSAVKVLPAQHISIICPKFVISSLLLLEQRLHARRTMTTRPCAPACGLRPWPA